MTCTKCNHSYDRSVGERDKKEQDPNVFKIRTRPIYLSINLLTYLLTYVRTYLFGFMRKVGLEVGTLRSRVACSTH